MNALSNSVLNSLDDDAPLMGTSSGSAFGWDRNQTNYRFGLTYSASERLTFRAGYAYGDRPNDNTIDATSFSVLTPNSKQHATLGASWQNLHGSEFHFAYSHYFKDTYRGPSAIFPGAEESVTAHVHILYFAWTILY